MSAHDHLNPRLFAPDPSNRRLPMRQFLEQAQWHSTDRPDWANEIRKAAVPVHSGTLAAAQARESDGDLYPVLPQDVASSPVSDLEANIAHLQFDSERGSFFSPSVMETVHGGMDVLDLPYDEYGDTDEDAVLEIENPATDNLRLGQSVPYYNDSEDAGSLSYVSPPGAFQTIQDADTGLAQNYSPKEFFTPAELRAQGMLPEDSVSRNQRIREEPRLFEETHSGQYIHHESRVPTKPGASPWANPWNRQYAREGTNSWAQLPSQDREKYQRVPNYVNDTVIDENTKRL